MEYRSKASFLGLPLFHFSTGGMVDGKIRRGVATGWVAIGDIAMGVLFACGGVATGGLCIGGLALGAISIGGLSIGLMTLGGCAVGIVAVGGAAFAWYAAVGGLAISHHYAIGGQAIAPHTAVPSHIRENPFSAIPDPPFRTIDAVLLFALIVALFVVALSVRERRRKELPPR